MNHASPSTRPPLHSRALASRSKSAPVVERASQPSPINTCVRFGAAFERETLPPLASVTPMMLVLPEVRSSFGTAGPVPHRSGAAPDRDARGPADSDVDAEV